MLGPDWCRSPPAGGARGRAIDGDDYRCPTDPQVRNITLWGDHTGCASAARGVSRCRGRTGDRPGRRTPARCVRPRPAAARRGPGASRRVRSPARACRRTPRPEVEVELLRRTVRPGRRLVVLAPSGSSACGPSTTRSTHSGRVGPDLAAEHPAVERGELGRLGTVQYDAAEADPGHAVQPIGAEGAVARARPTCTTGAGLHVLARRPSLANSGVRTRRAVRRSSAATRRSRWISLASSRPSSGYMPSMLSISSV